MSHKHCNFKYLLENKIHKGAVLIWSFLDQFDQACNFEGGKRSFHTEENRKMGKPYKKFKLW